MFCSCIQLLIIALFFFSNGFFFCLLFYRLKIFGPIALLSWSILVPVNWTSDGLQLAKLRNVTSSNIDKLSISNVERGSDRFVSERKLCSCYF